MRLLRIAIIASFLTPLALAVGCGDDGGEDHDPFDTFQACFDDHHKVETFSVQDSIKICCIDHPIGNPPVGPNVVCGETATACQTYVTANLASVDAPTADITAACAGYITDRDK
jgi:hypothetical protein